MLSDLNNRRWSCSFLVVQTDVACKQLLIQYGVDEGISLIPRDYDLCSPSDGFLNLQLGHLQIVLSDDLQRGSGISLGLGLCLEGNGVLSHFDELLRLKDC